jgi:hypothetical protein
MYDRERDTKGRHFGAATPASACLRISSISIRATAMPLDFRTFPGAPVSAVGFRGSGADVEDEGVVYPLFWRAVAGPNEPGSSDSVYWPVLAL